MSSPIIYLDQAIDRITEIAVEERPIGRLPYRKLDGILGGVRKGTLTVIAAQPGIGKTSLVNSIALSLAGQSVRSLFFTLELTTAQMVAKSIAAMSDGTISPSRLHECRDDVKLATALEAAKASLREIGSNLAYVDTVSSAEKVCSLTTDAMRRRPCPTAVFVDYLQLLASQSDPGDERTKVAHAIRKLKTLAKKHGVAVYVISSVNRSSYGSPVDLDSLSSTGLVEFQADAIVGISIPGKKAEQKASRLATTRTVHLDVVKNRNGGEGSTNLLFDAEFGTFSEII
ncbi:MAG: DnaB-like helicase C-terminal domain-containing protein [Coriobacteriia bacterium]|nr:DnaB-like helicase C-terminal domain-containing protein [Coriobacteriia bacterium]